MNCDRLEALLAAHRVDALIATSPENIRYVTDYQTFQGVWNRFPKAVIVAKTIDKPVLVLPIAEVTQAYESVDVDKFELIVFGASNFHIPDETALDATSSWISEAAANSANGIVEAILETLSEIVHDSARVAVDRGGDPQLFRLLLASERNYQFVDNGEDLWRLVRMVKTRAEVVRLKRAVEINELGISSVYQVLGRKTDTEIEQTYRTTISAAGGTVQHWVGGSGKRAGAYHKSRHEISEVGSRWRFDCGIEFEGYCSDLGGTAQIGCSPSHEESRIYAALTNGIEAGIAAAKPGIRTSSLYEKVIGAVRKSGLPDYRFSLVGHGIGVEPRDLPIIAPGFKTVSPFFPQLFDPELEENMVLNIECPLNQLGIGGFQHEITMMVSQDGGELLSELRNYDVVNL
uniref:M24 family metallopeptidase n=1 Tax=Roseovarius indicus TaxID=540747 RepID=UPI003B519F09